MKPESKSAEIAREARELRADFAESWARSSRCEATMLRACALELEAGAASSELVVAECLDYPPEVRSEVAARARGLRAGADEAMAALRELLTPLANFVMPENIEHWHPSLNAIKCARLMLKNPVKTVTAKMPNVRCVMMEARKAAEKIPHKKPLALLLPESPGNPGHARSDRAN